MGHSGFGQICPDDWEEALNKYEKIIALGSEAVQVKATIKVANLSKQAPHHVLSSTIPILAMLLAGNSSNHSSFQPIQEAAAYCLKCVASQGDGAFATEIGQSGALVSILRLLPLSGSSFRKVLVKCLWCLVNSGSANRMIAARNGGLEIVIDMLNSCMDSIRLYLLEILSALALLREVRRVIIRLRGLRFLVEAASRGSMISRERACHAIGVLGISRRARLMLVELGVIPVLVELFHQGDMKTKLVVGNTLGVISAHVDSIRPLAQAGAIPLYVELLQGPDIIGKEIAEDVFCLLAVAESNAVAIAEHLVRILREGDDGAKIAAADVVWDLAGYKHSFSVVRNSGAIPILVELLRDGSSFEIKEKASGAIAQLSYDEENRAALADAGAVAILIELLRDELEELRDNAAEALINFSEDPWQRDVIAEAVDAPSFQIMQNRLAQIHTSDEHIVRSLRRMSNEQLAWDPDLT